MDGDIGRQVPHREITLEGVFVDEGEITTNLAAVTQLLDTAPDLHPPPLAPRHGPYRSPGQTAERSADASP